MSVLYRMVLKIKCFLIGFCLSAFKV